ncbi:hypothetical protein BCR35DRAFT_299636 [Leucosporidium creatinivorum]|uniref:Uncharacterized protein n=1 Tax=Leucosporidium creatinivorum TaxID=106004 RepID=A0A1Y2G0F0_9BASI|nr:hypothetical protein BCR35DRAFT_299636 [Leucosporidium creatinivorum]
MATGAITATTQTRQQDVSVLFLRGSAEQAILEHSAHQQAPAPSIEAARPRADREYPPVLFDADWWPQGVDVPSYRPLNREVDMSRRPWAATPAEVRFVSSMLTGVLVIGCANRAWRSTFGRVTDKVWKYPIGGQF